MLWYKAWIECKFRLLLSISVLLPVLLAALWIVPEVVEKTAANPQSVPLLGTFRTTAPHGSAEARDQLGWRLNLDLFAGVLVPIVALMLAGSRLNTQTNYGMRHGIHPSLHFTLSLPVSRKKLFGARVVFGLALLLGWLVISLLAIWGVSQFSLLPLSLKAAWTVLPFQITGALVCYAFAVLLCVVFDEFWAGTLGMGIAGLMLGLSASKTMLTLLGFMEARPVFAGDGVPWGGFVICLGLTAMFLAGSLHLIETREY
jgi:hypothetical protein